MAENDKNAGAKGFFGGILMRLRHYGDVFLDVIFPRQALVAEIEAMDGTAFVKAAFEQAAEKAAEEIPHKISDDTYAIFPYRNRSVRAAIWQIKYRRNQKIAALMSEFLRRALVKMVGMEESAGNLSIAPNELSKILIIPIPISAERRKERGYNQIELVLGKMISTPFGQKIRSDILRKIKHTAPQTLAMNRAKRLGNLSGCFAVTQASEVQNKIIILVDDVLTTGATISEVRKTLLDAGAKRVIAIALAH